MCKLQFEMPMRLRVIHSMGGGEVRGDPPEQKSNFGNAQQIHISSGKANAMLGPKHDANARRMA